MDKADKILEAEREKSRQIIKSRRTALRPIAILLFIAILIAAAWMASDVFEQVSRKGIALLMLSLVLVGTALYLLQRQYINNKLISLVIRLVGTLLVGYIIIIFINHYSSA